MDILPNHIRKKRQDQNQIILINVKQLFRNNPKTSHHTIDKGITKQMMLAEIYLYMRGNTMLL